MSDTPVRTRDFRAVSAAARRFVIDRARDEQGHVRCHHCHDPITDEQQVTVHHVVALNRLHTESFDTLCAALGIDDETRAAHAADTPDAQADLLIHHLNHTDNLRPLHAACHMTVDFGVEFPPDRAEEYNLKPGISPAMLEGKRLAEWIAEQSPSSDEMQARLHAVSTRVLAHCERELSEHVEAGRLQMELAMPRTRVMTKSLTNNGKVEQLSDRHALVARLMAERTTAAKQQR